jgi:hypothetical protein
MEGADGNRKLQICSHPLPKFNVVVGTSLEPLHSLIHRYSVTVR